MELQFASRDCSCLRCVTRETASQELTQELRLSDGMPDVGRVLYTWGQVILRSKEWMGDTVTVTGGVMVWILYAPEDGTQPRCMDTWIPWQLRWNRMESRQEGPLRITPVLRFADSRTVSPRKFMVRAGVMALAEAFCGDTCQICSPVEVPEDVQLYRQTYPVRLPKEAGEKTFQLDEELEMPAAVPEKLIGYTLKPVVTDTRVLGSRIVFRGNCNLHLVYQCREGRIRVRDFEIPFSQYNELNDSYGSDSCGEIQLAVTNLELDMEEEKLRLKCSLVGQYLVDDREMVELVEDAYSTCRQVDLKTQPLNIPAVLERRAESIPVSAQIHGAAGELVDISVLPDHPVQRICADGVAFEVNGVCQVLYRDENGDLQTAAARWSAGHTMAADGNCRVCARLAGEERFDCVMTESGMELRGKLELQTQTVSDAGMNMVTALELGEVKEPDPGRPSLILRRVDGQTLWELAKCCGSTPEMIRAVNGLENEPDSRQMLLIPVK